MSDESMTLRREDWAVFGLRWLALGVISILYYILSPGMAVNGVNPNLIVTFFIGAVINVMWLVAGFYPLFVRALPYVTVVGDCVIAGLYIGMGFNQPLLLVGIAGGLTLAAAARLNWVWMLGHVVSVLGVIAGVLYVQQGAQQFNNLLRGMPAELILMGAVGIGAVCISFVREAETRTFRDTAHIARQQADNYMRRMRERNRIIADMTASLSATLDSMQVLDTALAAGRLGVRNSGAYTEPELIAAAMLFREDGQLHVVRAHGMTHKDFAVTVPGKSGILGQALVECVPVFGRDGRRDGELQFFAAFQRSRSLLAIPLHANFDNFGVLIYGSEDPAAFTQDDTDLLMAIGTQTTIALHNAVLYHNLLEEKERIVEVEEDARKKLARDLHDGPTQNVSAIAMRMSYISRLLERSPHEVPLELKKVEDLARKTTREIRNMLFTLRPLVLESQGLSAALDQLCEKTLETHGQHVAARVGQGVESVLTGHQQGVIFYIVEEAVGNARKHAEAELISINIQRQGDVVLVEIADNGVGFDADAVNASYDQRGSLGMVNMRERAELLNGTLTIDSAEGRGTRITILLPIDATERAMGYMRR